MVIVTFFSTTVLDVCSSTSTRPRRDITLVCLAAAPSHLYTNKVHLSLSWIIYTIRFSGFMFYTYFKYYGVCFLFKPWFRYLLSQFNNLCINFNGFRYICEANWDAIWGWLLAYYCLFTTDLSDQATTLQRHVKCAKLWAMVTVLIKQSFIFCLLLGEVSLMFFVINQMT